MENLRLFASKYTIVETINNIYLNCKYNTFGFLNTLKVHIQSNYLTRTTLSLLQTKRAEKNSKLIFYVLHSLVSDFKSVIAMSSTFTGLDGELCRTPKNGLSLDLNV